MNDNYRIKDFARVPYTSSKKKEQYYAIKKQRESKKYRIRGYARDPYTSELIEVDTVGEFPNKEQAKRWFRGHYYFGSCFTMANYPKVKRVK